MKKVSSKQAQRNREIAKIKNHLSPFCEICGRKATDAAHLLPKSIYPEYYTLKDNIVGLCRECHDKYDNDLTFRKRQKSLYERICKYDEEAAKRHFQIWK